MFPSSTADLVWHWVYVFASCPRLTCPVSLILTSVAERITRPVKAYPHLIVHRTTRMRLSKSAAAHFQQSKPCLPVANCAASRPFALSSLIYAQVQVNSSVFKSPILNGDRSRSRVWIDTRGTHFSTSLSFQRRRVASFSFPPACL
jgi:hypothetical protein